MDYKANLMSPVHSVMSKLKPPRQVRPRDLPAVPGGHLPQADRPGAALHRPHRQAQPPHLPVRRGPAGAAGGAAGLGRPHSEPLRCGVSPMPPTPHVPLLPCLCSCPGPLHPEWTAPCLLPTTLNWVLSPQRQPHVRRLRGQPVPPAPADAAGGGGPELRLHPGVHGRVRSPGPQPHRARPG